MNAHADQPSVSLSALPGEHEASSVAAPGPEYVSRRGVFRSLASSTPVDAIADRELREVRELYRRDLVEPQLRAFRRSGGSPGQAVGAAALLLAGGDFAEAVEVLGPVASTSNDYWVHHYLALARWRNGEREAALACLHRLMDERPSDSRPRHALGRVLMSAGRWAEATKVLSEATSLRDATAAAFADLGAGYLQQRKPKDAVRALRASLKRDGRLGLALNNLGVCYLLLGDRNRARRQFLQTIAVEPRCRAALDNLVELYIAEQNWPEAETVLGGYLDQHPHDVAALDRLAWVNFASGRSPHARKHLERAVRSPTAGATTWNNFALVCADLADFVTADRAFRRAIDLAPNEELARTNYARVLMSHGRHADVIAAIPDEMAFRSPELCCLRGNALAQLVPNDDKTLSFLRRAHERFPDVADLQALLGYVLTSFALRHDEAIAVLTHGLSQHPGHPVLANNLAYALVKRGLLAEARTILSPLIERQDDSPVRIFILATWGLLQIREGAYQEGRQAYVVARNAASGRSRARLDQKLAVEDARHFLARGDKREAVRLARIAQGGVDVEFAEEARQLLLPTTSLN